MKSYFQARTTQLLKEVEEIIEVVDHDGLRGAHAENLLVEHLKNSLPTRFGVCTGIVHGVSSNGKLIKSKQVDVIIFDQIQNPPIHIFGVFNILPSEAVCAVISVKLSLNTQNLMKSDCNAFENLYSVKQLPRASYFTKKVLPGVIGGGTPDPIITCVFAFKSTTSLNRLGENITDFYVSENKSFERMPDIVCVLDQGNLIIDTISKEITVNDKLVEIPIAVASNEALMIFTCLLVSLLNKQIMMPVNFFTYAYAQNG